MKARCNRPGCGGEGVPTMSRHRYLEREPAVFAIRLQRGNQDEEFIYEQGRLEESRIAFIGLRAYNPWDPYFQKDPNYHYKDTRKY